ncbi:MAG: N-acetyl-gamma-glutamyl-phosphate reductase [Planctomycetota bacterium]
MTLAAPIDEGAPTGTKTVPLFVVGSTGMLAGELLRLVDAHPVLRLAGAVSRDAGRPLQELHPHLGPSETVDLATATAAMRTALEDPEARVALVLGLPHGASASAWRALRSELGDAAERVLVVDLSADYRLRDAQVYTSWYGHDHADPDELPRFVYGLPELGRDDLVGARRVAAPGCFATALQLATAPAVRAGLLDADGPWNYSAVTGSSGSGVVPSKTTHHPFRNGNLWAYGLGGHRHEAELAQTLARYGVEPEVCFVPHSGPFARGIHLTAMLPLARVLGEAEARAAYADAYRDEPFVRLEDEAPDLRRVVGSNSSALGVFVRGRTLLVLTVLDNMIKGGAGQALQSMNLMLGLPEHQSLPRLGLGVV